MIASAHITAGALAGMASARSTENRASRIAMALVLGILSHVVFDAIPHGDYAGLSRSAIHWVVIGESVGMCAMLAYILRPRLLPGWPAYLLAGVGGATIPDAKFAAARYLPPDIARSITDYGDAFHSFFHADSPAVPLVGWGIEIACALLLLGILTRLPRTTRQAGTRAT